MRKARRENFVGEDMIRTNVYIPKEALKELKIKLIRENKSVSQWFRETAERYLYKN
ncbi:hypothetical protein HYW61_02190 [candidate division WWE3 bacterium]|nr:hypothetical protein [candidate division WWE3 bacterium]